MGARRRVPTQLVAGLVTAVAADRQLLRGLGGPDGLRPLAAVAAFAGLDRLLAPPALVRSPRVLRARRAFALLRS